MKEQLDLKIKVQGIFRETMQVNQWKNPGKIYNLSKNSRKILRKASKKI